MARPTNSDSGAPWHRLHAAALIPAFGDVLRTAGGFAVALLALRIGDWGTWRDWRAWAPPVLVALVICCAAYPVISWARKGYRFTADGVEWRQGVLSCSRRSISYANIHAVNATASPILRLFGVEKLTLSTGDSTDGDITLAAVPASVQEFIEHERAVYSARSSATGESSSAQPVVRAEESVSSERRPMPSLRISTTDILKFAVTDVHMLAIALIIWQVISQLDDIAPQLTQDLESRALAAASGSFARTVVILLVVLAVLFACSIVLDLVRYYDMHVWRRGDSLVIERGLLTRRHAAVPVRRIRTVVIERTILRRITHLNTVRIGLAAGADDADNSAITVLLPAIDDAHIYGALREILPEWAPVRPRIRRTGSGLLRYYITVPAVFCALTVLAAGILASVLRDARWYALALVALVPLWQLVASVVKYRVEGVEILPEEHGALPHRIAVRGGRGWGEYTVFTRRACAQMVRTTTPFWRMRSGIGSLHMPVFVMNGIDELVFTRIRRADARELSDWLCMPAEQAATTDAEPPAGA